MQLLGLTLALALGASAVPLADSHAHANHMSLHSKRHNEKYGANTFFIHVHNNCPDDKHFATYQIDSSFQMIQMSDPKTIKAGKHHTIPADFSAIGMRLSGNADWGCDGQWDPQALFEYGASAYGGTSGTAYDISMMQGSDPSIGIAVYPSNDACESKTCSPDNCAPDQGWTSPGQVSSGSPADTVCYQGMTDFTVVWCA